MFAHALLWGLLLFGAAFLCHIPLWRILKPKRQILGLVMLFGMVAPAVLAAGLAQAGHSSVEIAYAVLLLLLLSSSYILSYPAMQAKAPSLEMVKRIAQGGPAGITYEDLRAHFAKQDLISCRQQDLLTEGLVRQGPDGGFHITLPAKAVLYVMRLLRRILGLPEGEG